ncbi:MAG: hypothetical protein JNK82_13500 [Myxococcaceae bacterium]|nr:hypothetical protein [Myxococcaceae bacterium]
MNPKLIDRWAPVVICVAGLVLAHHEMVLSGFAVTQNDLGDTRFVHYLLEHGLQWLLGNPLHADFWSPPYFAPAQGHGAWSETMAGAIWVYVPFRILFDPHDAFQAWGLALGALNFFAAYLLLKRGFSFSTLGASVGSALFAFSAVRINQTMHWQLFPHFYTPIALYAAYRLAAASKLTEQQRVGHIFLLVGATVGQLWSSIYLGWFLVFVLAVGLALGLCWEKPRQEFWPLLKNHPWSWALALALGVAVLLPMGWRYLAVEKEFGGRPFNEVLTMLPMPTTWLHMGKDSWLWGSLASWPTFKGISMEHEQRCGFGLIASGLAALTFWQQRKDPRVIYVGVLLVVLLATTTLYSADGTTPWRIVYEYFPAAKAIRAVSRASIVYMLGISVAVAAALTALAKNEQLKWAVLPIGALLVYEQGYNTPAFSKADNRRDIAAVVAAIEPGCEVMLMSPVQGYGPYWKYQLDAMWASLVAGVPTVNGYSGQSPKNWPLGDTDLRSPNDEQRVQQAASYWFQSQPKLKGKKPCWARVGFNEGPNFGSEFVSMQAPAKLPTGAQADVEVTYKNLGPKPWPMGVGVRLGAQAPQDNSQWGRARVELPHEVAPGQNVTFRFPITAPLQPGQYAFQWRIVVDGVQWVGALTKMHVIDVVPSEVPPLLAAPPDAGQ